ncbi:hypothetical protein SCUCBS95973_001629 [Sporothrix curviconia]|uniref:Secreted protein n=1 Tax=Sporothrix curviconia TaxID=1260050 RepID=A0ABP0B076_9PEZI
MRSLCIVGLAAALGPLTLASPQAAAVPPVAINPAVLHLAETGSGCPIGSGGMVHEIRNGTPVFLFMGWGLTLNGSSIPATLPAGSSGSNDSSTSGNGGAQDNRVKRGSVAKFCKESISLGNAPVGYQVHIGEVSITGYAALDSASFVGVRVNTRFDHAEAGRATATVKASDLHNGSFSVTLTPSPMTWSPCINSTGLLPVISVRTSVSVNGTAQEATNAFSSGSLGGDMNDMTKALGVHFVPEWRPCPAEALAPLSPSPSPSSTATATAAPPTVPEPAPTAAPVPDPPIKDPPAPSPPMSMGGM